MKQTYLSRLRTSLVRHRVNVIRLAFFVTLRYDVLLRLQSQDNASSAIDDMYVLHEGVAAVHSNPSLSTQRAHRQGDLCRHVTRPVWQVVDYSAMFSTNLKRITARLHIFSSYSFGHPRILFGKYLVQCSRGVSPGRLPTTPAVPWFLSLACTSFYAFFFFLWNISFMIHSQQIEPTPSKPKATCLSVAPQICPQ